MDGPILTSKIIAYGTGRKVKDDLHSNVSAGFITASWNTWLDAKGAKETASWCFRSSIAVLCGGT